LLLSYQIPDGNHEEKSTIIKITIDNFLCSDNTCVVTTIDTATNSLWTTLESCPYIIDISVLFRSQFKSLNHYECDQGKQEKHQQHPGYTL